MNKYKKYLLNTLVTTFSLLILTGCDLTFENSSTSEDVNSTLEVGNKLSENQPTPTDIEYSLERYNLTKRTYWVNGEREKALSLTSPIDRPLGYIVLFSGNGSVLGRFTVDGKVTSLNSFLTPDSEYFEKNTGYRSGSTPTSKGVEDYSNKWLADVDGSYGENDAGIFFFTTDGKYIEFTGDYLYSDIPFEVEDPILKVGE